MNNDWFEITTNPRDPTNITMRRLSDEEARQAYAEQLRSLLEYYAPQFLEEVDKISDNLSAIIETLPDEKQEARQRSREDVQRKRRELRRKGGG